MKELKENGHGRRERLKELKENGHGRRERLKELKKNGTGDGRDFSVNFTRVTGKTRDPGYPGGEA